MQFLFLRQIGRLGNIGMLFWHKNVAQASDLSQKVGWNVARSAYLSQNRLFNQVSEPLAVLTAPSRS